MDSFIQANIQEAHELGLHDDQLLRIDCPSCLSAAFTDYSDQCNQMLHALERHDAIPVFSTYMDELAAEPHGYWVLHDHPAYTLAHFFGIDKLGEELEADPEFQKIVAAYETITQQSDRTARSR